ncbi:G-type lectin S-receptor-like serine/threonine-protein kinase LECRK2 [Bidens hawaiensis]|uniref:G-type lectin S-receptor-like serine/threonine-protein kinase LECRK2 n=1 Tax=Bidens hawaiensis TaxID=980011 RepID=UPI004049D628
MALAPLHLIIFLSILLHFVVAQQINGSVSVGASLTATPNAEPWLSSSGEFAFGFKQVQGKDNFLLSIWYDKIPDKTIIWYPEGGPIVSTGSNVELVDRRGLVLSDTQGKELWSSRSICDLAYGYMNNTGNFVIVGSNSHNIRESFDHPADTMLPTQVMASGGVINSKMSKTSFTGGRFQLRLLQDGNLVLNTLDMFSGTPANAYYNSGTCDSSNSINSGFQLVFDETGHMYILRKNGNRVDLTIKNSLDSDGVFTQYYYPKNPTEATSWKVIWFVPENICATRDSKAYEGFSLLDPSSPSGDCKPDFPLNCDGESNHGGDVFDFVELTNTD